MSGQTEKAEFLKYGDKHGKVWTWPRCILLERAELMIIPRLWACVIGRMMVVEKSRRGEGMVEGD